MIGDEDKNIFSYDLKLTDSVANEIDIDEFIDISVLMDRYNIEKPAVAGSIVADNISITTTTHESTADSLSTDDTHTEWGPEAIDLIIEDEDKMNPMNHSYTGQNIDLNNSPFNFNDTMPDSSHCLSDMEHIYTTHSIPIKDGQLLSSRNITVSSSPITAMAPVADEYTRQTNDRLTSEIRSTSHSVIENLIEEGLSAHEAKEYLKFKQVHGPISLNRYFGARYYILHKWLQLQSNYYYKVSQNLKMKRDKRLRFALNKSKKGLNHGKVSFKSTFDDYSKLKGFVNQVVFKNIFDDCVGSGMINGSSFFSVAQKRKTHGDSEEDEEGLTLLEKHLYQSHHKIASRVQTKIRKTHPWTGPSLDQLKCLFPKFEALLNELKDSGYSRIFSDKDNAGPIEGLRYNQFIGVEPRKKFIFKEVTEDEESDSDYLPPKVHWPVQSEINIRELTSLTLSHFRRPPPHMLYVDIDNTKKMLDRVRENEEVSSATKPLARRTGKPKPEIKYGSGSETNENISTAVEQLNEVTSSDIKNNLSETVKMHPYVLITVSKDSPVINGQDPMMNSGFLSQEDDRVRANSSCNTYSSNEKSQDNKQSIKFNNDRVWNSFNEGMKIKSDYVNKKHPLKLEDHKHLTDLREYNGYNSDPGKNRSSLKMDSCIKEWNDDNTLIGVSTILKESMLNLQKKKNENTTERRKLKTSKATIHNGSKESLLSSKKNLLDIHIDMNGKGYLKRDTLYRPQYIDENTNSIRLLEGCKTELSEPPRFSSVSSENQSEGFMDCTQNKDVENFTMLDTNSPVAFKRRDGKAELKDSKMTSFSVPIKTIKYIETAKDAFYNIQVNLSSSKASPHSTLHNSHNTMDKIQPGFNEISDLREITSANYSVPHWVKQRDTHKSAFTRKNEHLSPFIITKSEKERFGLEKAHGPKMLSYLNIRNCIFDYCFKRRLKNKSKGLLSVQLIERELKTKLNPSDFKLIKQIFTYFNEIGMFSADNVDQYSGINWLDSNMNNEEVVPATPQKGFPKNKRKGLNIDINEEAFDLIDIQEPLPSSQEASAVFKVQIHASSLFLMEVHSHLYESEIIGLLGGVYDFEDKVLNVLRAIPCRSEGNDFQCEMEPLSQLEANELIRREGLSVVGWYHSHPTFSPLPSNRDIENQVAFGEVLSGAHNIPFLGIILNPYATELFHRSTKSKKKRSTISTLQETKGIRSECKAFKGLRELLSSRVSFFTVLEDQCPWKVDYAITPFHEEWGMPILQYEEALERYLQTSECAPCQRLENCWRTVEALLSHQIPHLKQDITQFPLEVENTQQKGGSVSRVYEFINLDSSDLTMDKKPLGEHFLEHLMAYFPLHLKPTLQAWFRMRIT